MYNLKKHLSLLSHISVGASGGLAAGVIVAIWEIIVIFQISGDFPEIWIIPYGLIFYGLLWGIVGGIIGVAGSIIQRILKLVFHWVPSRATAYLIYSAFMFFIVSFRVGQYRYHQIILESEKVFRVIDWLIIFGSIILAIIILGGIWKLLSRFGIFKLMAGIVGAMAWYISLSIIALIIAGIHSGETFESTGKTALASEIEGKNVIFIIIDTLRFDRLSINGNKKYETSNFDAFAKESINFTRHYGQSTWTKPQIASALTGMYASSHRAMGKADILPNGVETIAEVFTKNGYYTVGVVDNVNIAKTFNFQQGFDEYYFLKPSYYFWGTESVFKLSFYSLLRVMKEKFEKGEIWPENYYQPAEIVNDKVFEWLDSNSDKRFFMFIHYMDPHDPFFEHPYNGVGYARASMENPPASYAQIYSDTYDQEIIYYDECLGELIKYLKENNLYDNSIIAMTADHGEEFYEHGGWWHGYTLYDEGLHIPLLLKPPAGTYEPSIDSSFVRTIDIAPTLVDMVEIEAPSSWQGENLYKREKEPSFIFAEEILTGNVIYSVRNKNWKYIEANPGNPRGLPPQELFKIREDPLELNNLVSLEPEIVRDMQMVLEEMKMVAAGQAVEKEETEIDDATRERLRALGYLK